MSRLDVGHISMFGCLMFFHAPFEKRTKLEPTAIKGIFVGYNETSKTYQIYILSYWKIVVWRDVHNSVMLVLAMHCVSQFDSCWTISSLSARRSSTDLVDLGGLETVVSATTSYLE